MGTGTKRVALELIKQIRNLHSCISHSKLGVWTTHRHLQGGTWDPPRHFLPIFFAFLICAKARRAMFPFTRQLPFRLCSRPIMQLHQTGFERANKNSAPPQTMFSFEIAWTSLWLDQINAPAARRGSRALAPPPAHGALTT